MEAASRYHRDTLEFARAITFFDAVYAIALTLLVVNVEPPPREAWTSLGAVLDAGLGGHLLGFAVSFVVIAVFWRANHRLLSGFRGLTPQLIAANLVGLAFVVLIPFTTQAISDPETSDAPLAIAFYAVDISAAVLGSVGVYWLARAQDALVVRPPLRVELVRLADILLTPVVFLLSIPIAYAWGADAGRWTWLALLVLAPISGVLSGRATRRMLADAGPGESDAGAAADTDAGTAAG